MSRTYDIQRWDGIILPTLTVPQPGIYIKPDDELFRLLNTREKVAIKIKGTASVYDNMLAFAEIRKSELVGGYRPNFQQKTGLSVVLPAIQWEGYPNRLGQVEILDFVEQPVTKSLEQFDFGPSTTQIGLCGLTQGLSVVLILAIMFVLREGFKKL